jgi:hypothetical protein
VRGRQRIESWLSVELDAPGSSFGVMICLWKLTEMEATW